MRDHFKLYLAQFQARELYASGMTLGDACELAAGEHGVAAGAVHRLADEALKACADALAEREARFTERMRT